MMDAQGRRVGLAFDGNRAWVSRNGIFDPALTRTIAVDSRYLPWVMPEVAPAPQLLQELGMR
ncbi:hypothetical protein A7D35_05585 [Xanthomonas arboricola]|nr:hypothetical protein A7D35_05585 [Xanthomonas arboricola]